MLSVEEFNTVVTMKVSDSDQFLDTKTAKTALKIVKNYDHLEPILTEKGSLNYFPIVYPDIQALYEKEKNCFWDINEIDMSYDKEHFMKLDSVTQHFIKNILGFFATADAVVADNVSTNFVSDIKNFAIQTAYRWQTAMEGIHAEMYGVLINEIINDEQEKEELQNAVNTIPCIQAKNAWAMKWAYSNAPFRQRVVANAISEGIFFSGSFCAIFWIKEKNIMPGLCQSNELISRDENMHCIKASLVYKKLLYPMTAEEIYEMVSDAVIVEKGFIIDSLQCDCVGMNRNLMSQYIEYVADVLLQDFGYNKLYNSKNPFAFMENINLHIKGNFFEVRNTSYKRAAVQSGPVTVDEDF